MHGKIYPKETLEIFSSEELNELGGRYHEIMVKEGKGTNPKNRTNEQINLVNKCVTSMIPILENIAHNLIDKGYYRHKIVSHPINLGWVSITEIDKEKIPVIDVLHEGITYTAEKFQNYDPKKGGVFAFTVSYAGPRMAREILRNIPNGTKIFYQIRNRKRKNLSNEKIFSGLPYAYPLSLTNILEGDERSKRKRNLEEEFLTSNDDPEKEVILRNGQELLPGLLSTLDDRSKDILKERYGMNKDMEKRTLENLSEKYGVSLERIRQLQVHAEEKLRKIVGEKIILTY